VPVLGIDYAFARPAPRAIADAGYSFVCRYLSAHTALTHGKILLAPEAARLRAAGLDIVACYEQAADNALNGQAQGVADARVARQQALAAGMPDDRPIYFSIGFDAGPAQQPVINAYLDGVASVLGRDRTGAYAGHPVLSRLFDAGKITWGWQTHAWSDGRWEPRAGLRQTHNGISVGGQSCDRDEAVAVDFGQWGGPARASAAAGGATYRLWGRVRDPVW
jgi:hypothetical protein